MNRSRPAVREAIKFIHEGGIGKVYMARGLCFKPRPGDRQVPRRPDGARREVRADRRRPTTVRADLRRRSTCRRSTTTCGSGRRRSGRSTATASTTTGTGTGTTATATPATRARTSSTSRAGACSKQEHPVKIALGRRLLRRAESSQETPNAQTSIFEYADGTILEFATRGEYTNDEGSARIGNLFYGTKGWVWIDGDGRKWQSLPRAARTRRAPAPTAADRSGRQRPERAHERRSARTTRTSSTRSARTTRSCSPATSMEGHLSSTLPHLANIAYRVGRKLEFDGKTETFVSDARRTSC